MRLYSARPENKCAVSPISFLTHTNQTQKSPTPRVGYTQITGLCLGGWGGDEMN